MTRWLQLGGALALAACATGTDGGAPIDPFVDNLKADGHAHKLKPVDDHALHGVDEPSDLALGDDGRLYTVSDAHARIYGIDFDDRGHPIADAGLDVAGKDLEALAFDPRAGEMVIGDEATAKIWHVDASGARHDPIELDLARDGNSGIEGLAFGPGGILYVAKEKQPARIIALAPDGGELAQQKIHFADDLSALAWNPGDDHLWALSDEDHAIYRLDADWDVEAAWRLDLEHPEGLAFDGDAIYVVSDSAQRLYVFALD